jgi:replication factor C subunit 1
MEFVLNLSSRSRVTGSPSSKTSYVVVGENAGPAKLNTIKKLKIATLDEDGFLNLIATREGKLDPKQQEKAAEEEQKIKAAARELEMRERRADKEARAAK